MATEQPQLLNGVERYRLRLSSPFAGATVLTQRDPEGQYIEVRDLPAILKAAEPFIAKHYEEKARKDLLGEISSLHPQEVTCRCEHGGTFEWEPHDRDCPRHEIGQMLAALASQEVEQSTDAITVRISVEGARSFVSDSPGWGAMGLQEVTEALLYQLRRAGHTPPFKPTEEPTDAH